MSVLNMGMPYDLVEYVEYALTDTYLESKYVELTEQMRAQQS